MKIKRKPLFAVINGAELDHISPDKENNWTEQKRIRNKALGEMEDFYYINAWGYSPSGNLLLYEYNSGVWTIRHMKEKEIGDGTKRTWNLRNIQRPSRKR
jgi:hypothetical protein